jgi:hypothetical protein
MDCLTTALDQFILYYDINPLYKETIIYYLRNQYTIHTRLMPLFIGEHITVQLIKNIEDIQPNTIIGIYLKEPNYLNVYGYHYFYVSHNSVISSWSSSRSITVDEYEQLEHRPRSLSETSIENGMVYETTFKLSIINQLWNLLNNDKDDIGYDLFSLFGGIDDVDMTLKKSDYTFLLYMYKYN